MAVYARWSPGGRYFGLIAAWGKSQRLRIFDPRSGRTVAYRKCWNSPTCVTPTAWQPDDAGHVVSATGTKIVVSDSALRPHTHIELGRAIQSLALSPNDTQVAVTTDPVQPELLVMTIRDRRSRHLMQLPPKLWC